MSRISWKNASRALACLALVAGVGCQGSFEYADVTDDLTVPGMGAACTPDWTGTEVPAAVQDALDEALTSAFDQVDSQIRSEIARKNAGEANVIRLDAVTLRMTGDPTTLSDQSTFGFLQEIRVYAESTDPDSELDRELVAELVDIEPGATVLALETTFVDLKPYIEEGLRITTDLVPRTCLRDDLTFRLVYSAVVRFTAEK